MRDLILLGPQANQPRVAEALRRLEIGGTVCAITAGWQERAGELEALREHLGREVLHLQLYQRTEDIFEADPELFQAHRYRQNRLRELQQYYRQRLSRYLEVSRWLATAEGDERLLSGERRDALGVVRQLDDHHLHRLDALRQEFEEEWRPGQRAAVRKQTREVSRLLSRCEAVLVAGGHVAVLLNRLRLFDLARLIGDKPVIAWSGGAMVMGERIVLFHDNPPQGPGVAEVLERGLGLYQGLLVLPHARSRLRLADPVRVSSFASRFHPLHAVPMDDGAFLQRTAEGWRSVGELYRMSRGGGLERVDHL